MTCWSGSDGKIIEDSSSQGRAGSQPGGIVRNLGLTADLPIKRQVD